VDGAPADYYYDDDTAVLRVYTDTLEGEPRTETDVHVTEETLPDGTVVQRRVTTTRQQKTIVKRVVMEGPEDELPTNEDEAEQILQQTDLSSQDEVVFWLCRAPPAVLMELKPAKAIFTFIRICIRDVPFFG